jgi:ATP-dependent helicase HrpA
VSTGPERSRRSHGRGGRDQHGHDARGRGQRTRDARVEARRAVVLAPIEYPPQLPVSARREDIAAAIRDHQVVIVAGETGSGKTTQIPKIALDLGRGRDGQIGHTQPRRIAARTVAERIAEELGTTLGEAVGYQVRFTDTSGDQTLVKVMTDGILLAQIQRDPMLLSYDTLIIDEAHERSLNIDFILGYLTQLLPKRPDLKVVITSATIDSERFAAHFAGPATREHPDGMQAPVVEVTGRTFPVDIRYEPLSPDPEPESAAPGGRPGTPRPGRRDREDRDVLTAICEAVDELCAEGPGDILVFLSGEREIRDTAEALTGHLGPRITGPGRPGPANAVEILPLYSRLSAADQHRVFESHATRRVVLATNVAETSLTVPGIRYVVDPGTARISRFSKATKVQRLPIEPISQASANQRSGRCGRVADGIAIRLYSEADFDSRPEFTEPEILRTSLASVILQMVAVGVASSPDDVAQFPFVDPPDVRAIRDGVQLLTELGALEAAPGSSSDDPTPRAGRLTDVGRALAQLPMDPRLGRMIVEGGRRDVAREVMIIAAGMSIQDPRERPSEQRAQADQAHARYADPTSDFLSYLNLWEYVKEQQRELSGSAFRRLCKAEFLNYLRLREWQDVVTQLRELAKPLGITVRPPGARATVSSGPARGTVRRSAPGAEAFTAEQAAADAATRDSGPGKETPEWRLSWDADRIHQSLLAGLLSHIGMQEVTEVRVGARGTPSGKDAGKGAARRQSRNEYLGARGARFAIFPGSGLARKPPAWIMAGELVETSRLWGRDVARIQPEWAEELASHLVKRTYSEPAWSTKQGAAMAFEKVLLYGVPIVTQRRVLYAKVDPEHARELFIRQALVEGEWTTHHAFFHENRDLLAEAERLEAKARRRGLVVDDEVLFDFYDERIPADVVSSRHFDQWWKSAKRQNPGLLSFTLDLLLPGDVGQVDENAFPSVWPQGDLELPLTYQFQPGTDADGVTVHIPLVVLNRVRPEGFDWMVPGLREELVTALIRSLAKSVRVQLVPAPDVAREVVAWIDANLPSWQDTVRAGDMADSLHEAFAAAVLALRGVVVPDDAWDDERLPPHLRMTFRVEQERAGQSAVVDEGKNLIALQRALAARNEDAVRVAVRSAVRAAVRSTPQPAQPAAAEVIVTAAVAERTGLRSWPDDLVQLPGTVTATGPGGNRVQGYPALVEERSAAASTTVALRVLGDAGRAAAGHRRGLRRLLLLDSGLATARVTTRWSGNQVLALAASPYRSTEALVTDIQLAAIDALLAGAGVVRDLAAWTAARALVRGRLEDTVHQVVGDVVAVLAAARELDSQVRGATSLALLGTLTDIRAQAAGLVHDGFVSEVGAARLPHLTRYLRAAGLRLAKAAENSNRDAELAWRVRELQDSYEAAQAAQRRTPDAVQDAALTEVRWMLEELRVSFFAQQLGTPGPVSEKRIRTALDALSQPRATRPTG